MIVIKDLPNSQLGFGHFLVLPPVPGENRVWTAKPSPDLLFALEGSRAVRGSRCGFGSHPSLSEESQVPSIWNANRGSAWKRDDGCPNPLAPDRAGEDRPPASLKRYLTKGRSDWGGVLPVRLRALNPQIPELSRIYSRDRVETLRGPTSLSL